MHTAIDKAKSEQQNIGAGSFTIESASDALARVRECIERALAERDHALPMHSTSWTKCSRSSCVSVSRPCLGQRRPPSLSETEAQQLYMQFADELLDVIKIIKQRRARIMGDDDEGGSMMG